MHARTHTYCALETPSEFCQAVRGGFFPLMPSINMNKKNRNPQHQKTCIRICVPARFTSACAFAQSDQNLRWGHFGQPMTQSFIMRTTKTLIRLLGCAGWFESTLGAHFKRCVFSRCDSQLFYLLSECKLHVSWRQHNTNARKCPFTVLMFVKRSMRSHLDESFYLL